MLTSFDSLFTLCLMITLVVSDLRAIRLPIFCSLHFFSLLLYSTYLADCVYASPNSVFQPKPYMVAIMALWYSKLWFSFCLTDRVSKIYLITYAHTIFFCFVHLKYTSNTFVNVWWNSPSKSHTALCFSLFAYGKMLSVSIVVLCLP